MVLERKRTTGRQTDEGLERETERDSNPLQQEREREMRRRRIRSSKQTNYCKYSSLTINKTDK